MRPFNYQRASDFKRASRLGSGTAQGQVDAAAQFLAGGTTLVDLMKLDVLRPSTVIDINALREGNSAIKAGGDGLHLGAFASMSKVADNPDVIAHYPVIAESLQLAASAQLRNMATLGGNVLQRTRCSYFRDTSWSACNKRKPGSGCAAINGFNRNHAVLGVDDSCISLYPGDFAVALIALDANVELQGPDGQRRIRFAQLHRSVDGKPHLETTLKPGEVISAFNIPAGAWTRRSVYVKVRDRQSYEFALASAAVALDLDGDTVRNVRIGLGGVAYKPWRAVESEAMLTGKPLTEASAEAAAKHAFAGAVGHGNNDYKAELGRRTVVRALMQAMSMSHSTGGA